MAVAQADLVVVQAAVLADRVAVVDEVRAAAAADDLPNNAGQRPVIVPGVVYSG